MSSNLFRRAFVSGLCEELLKQGAIVFPSKEASELASDHVADNSGLPDPITEGDKLNYKIATNLCNALVETSKYLCKQAGDKYSPELSKTAAATSPQDAAISAAWRVMEKCAAETGTLMQGGDHPNTLPAAAAADSVAALEEQRRPLGYATLGEHGVGNWEGKGIGVVGVEEKHPEAPRATDPGSNSLIETSSAKQGSLAEIVARLSKSAGALMRGGDAPNTLSAAATHDESAALEAARRPEGYAVKGESGVGQTSFTIPPGAVVGVEQKHPQAPAATGSGTNSVIKMSAFDALFEETAKDVVSYLPEKMAEEQKVAHVRAMMGLDTVTRGNYLSGLYEQLGSTKEACELVKTHFIKSAALVTKKACEECPVEKKEEKKEGHSGLPPALREHMFKSKDESPKVEKEEHKEAADISRSLGSLRAALANLRATS